MMKYELNAATNAGLIEIQIEYRAVAELILDSRKPGQHAERQINELAYSIREFGFVMPVVADGRGQIVIGHGRVLAARKLRMPRIPDIRFRDCTPICSRFTTWRSIRTAAPRACSTSCEGSFPGTCSPVILLLFASAKPMRSSK